MDENDLITTVPLTTRFTRPSDCSSSWTFEASDYNGVESGLLLQNAIQSSIDSSCFPSGFNQAGRDTVDYVVFSPGACPHGYTTNSAATTVAATTTASCCLSGYYFYSSEGRQGCRSTYTGTTFLAARAGGLGSSVDLTSSTTASGTIEMWGQPITIMYQESEQSLYTTSTTTTTSSSPATITSSPLPDPPSSSTLSDGAKAGIAVGSIVGALLLFGFAFVFWRRRTKKTTQGAGGSHGNMLGGVQRYGPAMKPAETPSELLAYRSTRSELDGQVVRGQARTFELE
ncbi:hypothetical protein BDW62DRAFT_237 [Aspergillus aurantiobrunneus]